MREILFRGKTIANNSIWVEGFYNHIPCGRFLCDEHCIQTIDEDGRIGQLFNVNESTVGQFTGLTDKNGEKIFEGDIVNILPEVDEIGVIEWEDDEAMFVLNAEGWYANFDNYYPEDVEVIGNIHDNPELLEGRQ